MGCSQGTTQDYAFELELFGEVDPEASVATAVFDRV
jgi:hypothetical protein